VTEVSLPASQGSTSSTFFVVKDGCVVVNGGRKFVAGDFFEERSLTADSKVEEEHRAKGATNLFQITRASFEAALAAVRWSVISVV